MLAVCSRNILGMMLAALPPRWRRRPMLTTTRAMRVFALLACAAIVLGLLSWLQGILVPIALALLLTFLLSPPVTWLQRRSIPRAMAVMLTVGMAVALSAVLALTLAHQLTRLVDDFPLYEKHLNAKILALRSDGKGFTDKLRIIVGRVSRQ